MGGSRRESVLRRPESAARSVAGPQVAWDADLESMIEQGFFEALDSGLWWGASELGASAMGSEDTLAALAKEGIRCACVGARAGLAGYLAIIAHPADAQRWQEREVSCAMGLGKRVDFGWGSMLFMRLGRGDFPTQPKVFGCNQGAADAAAFANREREALEEMLQSRRPGEAKRL